MRDIDVFKLAGSIFVDTKDAEKGIDGIAKKSEGLGSKLGGAAKTVGKWGLAIGAGAVAAGTALTALVMKTTAVGDNIHKHSQKIGMSTTAYQEWDYVLGQNGISMDGMDRYMRKVDESMRVGTDGVIKGKGAYDKLGISLENTNGTMKTQEEVFEDVITGLQGMDEGTERNSIAAELLGSKYAELNPLLNGTAEETDELKQKLHEMGGVMSEDAVNAAADFNDQMDDLKRGFAGVFREVATQLMPIFSELVGWITANMPKIKEVMTNVFEKIGQVTRVVIDIFRDHLIPMFQKVVDWVSGNWDTISTVIAGVFKAVQGVWNSVLKPVLGFIWDNFKKVVDWVSANWGTISNTFKTVFGIIKGVWDNVLSPVLSFLWETMKKIVTWVANSFGTVSDTFSTVFRTIKTLWETVLRPPLDTFLSVVKSLVQWVNNNFPGVGRVFSGAFDVIKGAADAVKRVFGWLSDAIKKAYDWLGSWNNRKMNDKSATVTVRSTGGGGTVAKSGGGGSSGGGMAGTRYSGLASVPYDGYTATLHKGERILTPRESKEYNKNKGLDGNKGHQTINIVLDNANIYDTRDIKEISKDLATQIGREVSFG